jgi:hypothetical protein
VTTLELALPSRSVLTLKSTSPRSRKSAAKENPTLSNSLISKASKKTVTIWTTKLIFQIPVPKYPRPQKLLMSSFVPSVDVTPKKTPSLSNSFNRESLKPFRESMPKRTLARRI